MQKLMNTPTEDGWNTSGAWNEFSCDCLSLRRPVAYTRTDVHDPDDKGRLLGTGRFHPLQQGQQLYRSVPRRQMI